MQSKLHRNVVHHGVELLLLVSMLFLLTIPKSLLILKEILCTSFIFIHCKTSYSSNMVVGQVGCVGVECHRRGARRRRASLL